MEHTNQALKRLFTLVMVAVPLAVPLRGQAPALRLRQQVIRDPMVNNEEAFTLLVPEGWRMEGGIIWRQELSNLALLGLRLADPAGGRAFEIFPNLPYIWNQAGFWGFPPGSLYLGSYVVQPVEPADFVRLLLVPQFRGRAGAQIIRTEPLPEWARQIAATVQEPGAVKQVAAARTRIEYQDNGRAMEEDIYCVMVYTQSAAAPGVIYWGSERAFGFRAEKGQLDRQAPLLQAISASVRLGPRWFGHVQQVRELWIQNQMQAIRNAGELSRYIARTTDEMSDAQQQAWQNRRASEDRTAEAFTRYIRGVENYRDPYSDREVQLPTGYSEVWASKDGQYILGNDPGFNPNQNNVGSWQRIVPTVH
jgi:hypothetical protein